MTRPRFAFIFAKIWSARVSSIFPTRDDTPGKGFSLADRDELIAIETLLFPTVGLRLLPLNTNSSSEASQGSCA